jgi:hypothetical protein
MATVSGHIRQLHCTGPRNLSCPSHPAGGVEIDFVAPGANGMAITDATGAYSIQLGAGTYKVHIAGASTSVLGPATIQVTAGQSLAADYAY